MPTYDYRCQRTGEMFEAWQSFRDEALTSCIQLHDGEDQECGAPVKKVFSKVGISFKGDGFYKNDHGANARARESERSKSDSSGKSSEPSTTKTDSGTSSSDSGSSNGSKPAESSTPSAS